MFKLNQSKKKKNPKEVQKREKKPFVPFFFSVPQPHEQQAKKKETFSLF